MLESDDRHPPLAAALRALAEADEELGASSGVERRLLAEVRSIARARRRRRIATALAVAAVLLLAVVVPAWRWRATQRPAGVPEARSATSRPEIVTSFFPLAYHDLPATNAQLVRMRVSRKALVSVGLVAADLPVTSLSGTVLADVLVGEDGLARAIRFVGPAIPRERQ